MASIKKPANPLQLEYRPATEIKPSAHNTRAHNPEQIDMIAKSITSVGWTRPIVVDEQGEILAGHGAYQAGLQLGQKEMPVVVRAGLSAAQKRAYRIADNKLAERSTWDTKALTLEFADLTKMGFDLSLTAFDASDIAFLLQPPQGDPEEPPKPDLQPHATSRLGDVWCMGEHRLICGDSTKATTYKTLMEGRMWVPFMARQPMCGPPS